MQKILLKKPSLYKTLTQLSALRFIRPKSLGGTPAFRILACLIIKTTGFMPKEWLLNALHSYKYH